MLFIYKATGKEGIEQSGSIEAPSIDVAIASLQRRGLILLSIVPEVVKSKSFLSRFHLFNTVKSRDIVILSRQIATLFEAKVSVTATFKLLAGEASSPILRAKLTAILDDVQAGQPISTAFAHHPDLFSNFYVSMVKSGEETGKLSETFTYLADYLERSYALVSRAKNALIYPIFIIFSFVVVLIIMLMFVIPQLSQILIETGQELPIYTRIVIGLSDFFVAYGVILLILVITVAIVVLRYIQTEKGRRSLDSAKLAIPYVGNLYQKLYLSRIADNLNTMLTSGISMVRALEITAEVVNNVIFRDILLSASAAIKTGSAVSEIMSKYSDIPPIMIQMMKVGEETGKLGFVLETLSRFYRREVNDAVDTLVGLIEPALIVFLGIGVGVLLTSVLVPIYNIASGF
ncbi:MAG: type II secretion system F family protein [Candidatus Vogelbacteria bacterium]|nr:type II secretion system F family protein [Candidatus Vogelbacteria bacterium]